VTRREALQALQALDPEGTGLVEVVVTPTGPVEATTWHAVVKTGTLDEANRVTWREVASATAETAGEARAAAVEALRRGAT
jgi:hypothetical protein